MIKYNRGKRKKGNGGQRGRERGSSFSDFYPPCCTKDTRDLAQAPVCIFLCLERASKHPGKVLYYSIIVH